MKRLKTLTFLILFCLTVSVWSQIDPGKNLIEEGLTLLSQNKSLEALEKFREAEELEPDNEIVQANIGVTLMRLERYNEAAAAFKKALNMNPNPEFRAEYCRALFLDGEVTLATKECRSAYEEDPDSALVNRAYGLFLSTQSGDKNAVAAFFERALFQFPSDVMLHQTAAMFYFGYDLTRTVEIYLKLSELDPKQPFWHVQRADVLLELERDAEAVEAAQTALRLDSNVARAHHIVGRVYLAIGQNAEASESFRSAIAIQPDNQHFLEDLATAEARRGRKDEAARILEQLVKRFPESLAYLESYSEVLNETHRYEEAIPVLQKILKLNRDGWRFKVNLGFAFFESGRHEEALRILNEANIERPGNTIVLEFLRVVRARQAGLTTLDNHIENAEKNPKDVSIRMKIITTLGFTKRLVEAEKYISEIVNINPSDPLIYNRIAIVYQSNAMNEKASDFYKLSVKKGENAGAFLGLANIRAKAGDLEGAKAAYEKVFELNPQAPSIMLLYVGFLGDNGMFREAYEWVKRSLALQRSNEFALLTAGMLAARFGEFESAGIYLEELRQIRPEEARKLERCIAIRKQLGLR